MAVVAVLLLALALAGLVAISLWRHFSPAYVLPVAPAAPGTVKVACVGDSHTFGMFLWNRAASCYPARLQALLGSGYAVGNFGANSQAVQKDADYCYVNHGAFENSTAYTPDIVIILLGSNDAKPNNWHGAESFKADYTDLVQRYLALPSRPQVYLVLLPIAEVVCQNNAAPYGMRYETMAEINQTITEIADELALPLVDLFGMGGGSDEYFIFDNVHFNKTGAQYAAQQIYTALVPAHAGVTP